MKSLFILFQRILPQHLLSRLVGFVANSRIRPIKNLAIRLFTRIYPVNVSEAVSSRYEDYATFNEFFRRRLRDGIRPVSGDFCSPADGSVSIAGRIRLGQMIQAKNHQFAVNDLLGCNGNELLQDGSFITIYLAPHDYHRVHVPVDARLIEARYIPGRLFSVNGITTERVEGLFAANERLVMHFETDLGPLVMVMVGAMIVAGIRTCWHDRPYPPGRISHKSFDPARFFHQGEEIGWFEMGSTVILLTPGAMRWSVNAGDITQVGQPIVAVQPSLNTSTSLSDPAPSSR